LSVMNAPFNLLWARQFACCFKSKSHRSQTL